MPFVERIDGGAINGLFARPQDGFPEEWIDESHPDVVAFRGRRTRDPDADSVEEQILSSPALRALIRRQATSEGKTEREVMTEIRSEVRPR